MTALSPRSFFVGHHALLIVPHVQPSGPLPAWAILAIWFVTMCALGRMTRWFPGKDWPAYTWMGLWGASFVWMGWLWPTFGWILAGTVVVSGGVVAMFRPRKPK